MPDNHSLPVKLHSTFLAEERCSTVAYCVHGAGRGLGGESPRRGGEGYTCSSWSQAMGQCLGLCVWDASNWRHQCASFSACMCFPREYQSCVTADRIKGLGFSSQGDHRWGFGYSRETSGLKVRYWSGYRSAQALRVCIHTYIQQKAWLPAVRLELQTHHCNYMNILVSKLSAKRKLMAERQRQGRSQDSAICDLVRAHTHPFPTVRLECLTQLSQREESAGRWLDRPPCMRLSRSQVTRSTFSGYVLFSQDREGARNWSREGHTRAALTWKKHIWVRALCSTSLLCQTVWWTVWKWHDQLPWWTMLCPKGVGCSGSLACASQDESRAVPSSLATNGTSISWFRRTSRASLPHPTGCCCKTGQWRDGPLGCPPQLLLCNYPRVMFLHSFVAQAPVLNS